jgi:hypothetical protein
VSNIDYSKYYTEMGFGETNDTFKDYIKSADIFNMVKKFIENIEYKVEIREVKTWGANAEPVITNVPVYDVFTLHDAVDRIVPVRKDNPRNPLEPSDYCKARDVFIKILQFIRANVNEFTKRSVIFKYASRFSGLSASSRTCTKLAEQFNKDPLLSVEPGQTSSHLKQQKGGSKSRRTRRRKHRRKTHHKHSRKTRDKRTHRSRAARKHKKYSRKH